MKKTTIFTCVSLWCFFCFGKVVWMRAPSTDFVEFEAYTSTESQKTFAQAQWDKIKISPRPVNLKILLAKAQAEFLSHDPLSAKPTYQEMVSHSTSYDWNLEERKIIFYSFFRIAQLEKDPARFRLFLKEALVFGKNLRLDLKLFPPPIVKAYQEIKKNTVFAPLPLGKIFKDHELILINGKAYKRTHKPLLPYGVYRVHALSSSHKPWTGLVSLSRLVLKKIKTQALVEGECGSAKIKHKPARKTIRVLFPGFCVWKEETLKPFKDFVPLSSLEKPVLPQKTSKKWWWVGGLSLVTLGVVSYVVWKSNKQKPGPGPSQGPEKPPSKPGLASPAPAPPTVIRIGF